MAARMELTSNYPLIFAYCDSAIFVSVAKAALREGQAMSESGGKTDGCLYHRPGEKSI